jgi:hypothetical protein
MSPADLYSELRAASDAVRQIHLDRFRALGLTSATVADFAIENLFGVANAEPIGGGHYQPGAGAVHVILPVYEDGELMDLCAFRSTAPGDWMTRTGQGWALGLKEGLGYHTFGQPLHLYSTPLDWLRGGWAGLCVLDWSSPEIRVHLAGLDAVTVDDVATAELLRSALTRPVQLPQISVLGGLARVA